MALCVTVFLYLNTISVPSTAHSATKPFTGFFFSGIVTQLMLKSNYFRRILGFVILVAAVATLVLIVRYFIDNARKDKKSLSRTFSSDITMKTIHFTESHQNGKKWELFAQNGVYDKLKEKTSLEDIRFIVERDSKNGPVTVTAKHGTYLHSAKIVQLSGNVLAKTVDGLAFETPRLDYDSAKQMFSTKDRIKLSDEALTVEGVGMDLWVDRQQSIVRNQVEATVYPGKRNK